LFCFKLKLLIHIIFQTFVVLNSNRVIYRFSEEKSLFLFGRENKIRQFFIKVLINKYPFANK